ncbi:MAG: head GIN domain-containing protein [Sphingobacteriia bacterium]
MKTLYLVAFSTILLFSCRWTNKKVEGNGKIVTQNRSVQKAEKIELAGNFDVDITQGNETAISIETDENLQPYIVINESGDKLVLKEKNNYRLESDFPIKIHITTPKLSKISLSGSGSVIGKNKFTGMDKLLLSLSGSGKMDLALNTPTLEVDIAGVGSMVLAGETKNAEFKIAGSGECDAIQLKTENTKVKVAGVGTIKVFADVLLDVNVAGSGTIYYKGAATIKQKIAGSGSIKQLD